MNVLVITPWFPDHPNDQHGNFVLDSIEALCAFGHSVHVLVTRAIVPNVSNSRRPCCNSIQREMFQRGFSLACVGYLSIPRNYFRFVSNRLYVAGCAGALERALKEYSIDVVHAHTELAGVLGCTVAGAAGVPVVTTLHGINVGKRYLDGLGQDRFMRRAFSCPDRLVLVGAPLMDFVGRYADRMDHVRIVHNGFRETLATNCRGRGVLREVKRLEIVSVSNLVNGKGIDVNIAALAQPEIARLSNWHYHVVGDGPMRHALEAQARQLDIADRVTFHGRRGHDEVYRILSGCHVFSLPSSPEAFGVAYLEAMACGLLAIGIASQGPSCFIKNGQTGILIRDGDVDELASRLKDILDNPTRYAHIAESGSEHVWNHLTWRAHASGMTDVFNEAIGCIDSSERTEKL